MPCRARLPTAGRGIVVGIQRYLARKPADSSNDRHAGMATCVTGCHLGTLWISTQASEPVFDPCMGCSRAGPMIDPFPDVTAIGPCRQLRAARLSYQPVPCRIARTSAPLSAPLTNRPQPGRCPCRNTAVLAHASWAASRSFWPASFAVPSPLAHLYRVVVAMPRRFARSCATVSRSAMARIALRSVVTSVFWGLPPILPLARAAARPARVRSTISSRSNSASVAKMPKTRRPLDFSHGLTCFSGERGWTPWRETTDQAAPGEHPASFSKR